MTCAFARSDGTCGNQPCHCIVQDKLKYAPRTLEAYERWRYEHARHRRLDIAAALLIGALAALIAAMPLICWWLLCWN